MTREREQREQREREGREGHHPRTPVYEPPPLWLPPGMYNGQRQGNPAWLADYARQLRWP